MLKTMLNNVNALFKTNQHSKPSDDVNTPLLGGVSKKYLANSKSCMFGNSNAEQRQSDETGRAEIGYQAFVYTGY